MRLKFLKASQLTTDQKEAIWRIYSNYYTLPKDLFFEELLPESTMILWLAPRSAEIVGFVSVDTRSFLCNGKRHRVIYTSRVLVHKAYRGNRFTAISGLRYFLAEKLRYPFARHYWFFCAGSLSGYAILFKHFKQYWPAPERGTPDEIRLLMEQVATHYYPDNYDKVNGVISANVKLKYDPFFVRHAPLITPFAEFYKQLVPDAKNGQVPACLAPLSAHNFFYWLQQTVQWKVRQLFPHFSPRKQRLTLGN